MEFRLRPLTFKEFFAKQQSSGSWENGFIFLTALTEEWMLKYFVSVNIYFVYS